MEAGEITDVCRGGRATLRSPSRTPNLTEKAIADQPSPAEKLEERFSGKYLSLISYKRDGTGIATPVWFVIDGGRLSVMTDPQSFKAKRIRRNPDVTIAPCTATGRLRSDPVPGRAELLPDSERAHLDQLMARKYSRLARVFLPWIDQTLQRLRGKPAGKPTAVLAITPLQPDAPDPDGAKISS